MHDRPSRGDSYRDASGRLLWVEEVVPGDPLGREVQGDLEYGVGLERRPGSITRPYACTLAWWARCWRDREPPVPREQQSLA